MDKNERIYTGVFYEYANVLEPHAFINISNKKSLHQNKRQ